MKRIQNITDEPIQRHSIIIGEYEAVLYLRYFPKTQHWTIGIEYEGGAVYGVKLSLSVLHMVSANFPFDFIVADNSDTGIDPFQRDDFVNGRCTLYMLTADEMIEVREGAEV